ncbi:FBP domain-containing protein [Microbacterium karelineae]|uniref:FBP domain-containing protein n=1 Tax=Microbacterium karelineae TaxID=2654283 RepID=UPI0012E9A7FD|nr:FBP domain-containing protein [Microbacterium karelineae]
MQELTAPDIRASFVNADDRDLEVLDLPADLMLVDWFHLDFLAWRDPSDRGRCYAIVELDGDPTGIVLRAALSSARAHNGICNICRTMQPGNQVTMMSARKGGEAGRRAESIGTYMCADASCHQNVRIAHPLAPNEFRANVDFRIDSTARRMREFVRRVRDAD